MQEPKLSQRIEPVCVRSITTTELWKSDSAGPLDNGPSASVWRCMGWCLKLPPLSPRRQPRSHCHFAAKGSHLDAAGVSLVIDHRTPRAVAEGIGAPAARPSQSPTLTKQSRAGRLAPGIGEEEGRGLAVRQFRFRRCGQLCASGSTSAQSLVGDDLVEHSNGRNCR